MARKLPSPAKGTKRRDLLILLLQNGPSHVDDLADALCTSTRQVRNIQTNLRRDYWYVFSFPHPNVLRLDGKRVGHDRRRIRPIRT